MPFVSTAIGVGTAVAGLGKALGWWGQPPKQRYKKSQEEIAYENELKRRSEHGIYSKGTQFNMLNRASQVGASALQNQQLRAKGQALFGGTRGVASRESAKVGQENLYRSLVEGSLQISDANELSKIQAQDQAGALAQGYSRIKNQLRNTNAQARYQARQDGFSAFTQGLGSIAGQLDTLLGVKGADATTLEGVLGKNYADLTAGEKGILRAGLLTSKDPTMYKGRMIQWGYGDLFGVKPSNSTYEYAPNKYGAV